MKFLQVNILSAIYGLLFLIETQLLVNVLRISRLTNLDINNTYVLVFIGIVVALITFSFVVYQYINKFWNEGKELQWSILLWLPTPFC
ncbi:hypothetical protein LC087_16260 [Bacillus carboniphilus]|uniref:Uncharacterized protein n=1 Tax=Bacillus carboniphilus TaxID=86663 RepID=A0ABY9JS82_9BACI|nr:hypothetical protein [Bacillus carboniphilus]WLR42262.1 hypothetical protein LC087_16260 [Bacillus carboniphilus]